MTATTLNFEQARYNMVEQQVRPWDVLDPRVLEVIGRIPREHFVPEPYTALAYVDTRIPLGEFNGIAYTMMNPNVEGRLLQHLCIQPEDSVLEIGSGSGYLSACLAALGSQVESVDINPAMTAMATASLAALNVHNVSLATGDAANGWGQQQYDVIAVTCSLHEVPLAYKKSLKLGGRLFVISGEAPAMCARLITCVADNDWSEQILFETSIEAMANCQQAEAFVF